MPRIRRMLQVVLALGFIAAGANHFASVATYLRIMPDYLPWHANLVYISGAAEILLGCMLLVPRTSSLAAWGVIALLVAVFPANVHMALHPGTFPTIPVAALWARLPLQAVLIAWAYSYTRTASKARSRATGGTSCSS